jgi:hypothetical protein
MQSNGLNGHSTYLQYDNFHTARQIKWEAGVKEYRLKPDDPFKGCHYEEAYQECLDLYNLLEDLARHSGRDMRIQLMQLQIMGDGLRQAAEDESLLG